MPNDSNGNFREGFNLPGDLRDIAQQELGETPAVKEQALHQLRELILGGWNTDICSLDDFLRICIVHAEHVLLQEEFQIRGVVAILDIKGLSVFHVAHYTPSVIRTFITLVQDCLPLRIKAVYIINNPALFDLLFAIAKPFMKAKLVNRIRFFGYDLEELHSLVPDDVIPEEHGGTNESYDFDTIEEELKGEEKFFEKINAYGYRKEEKNGK
ncbi:alpha-tocopherol transfer protein-like isoform X2 [Dermacentor andersoni]|uniref:alpha-tocopherol transfer protein-like isoform X2 n=1 Tax=Dermacentor andersoni TaxID=34620 RepID=UPI0024176046|nr:alpha-tocopherol transfer protein-like isoform X2 [Dermacentor andersoni]